MSLEKHPGHHHISDINTQVLIRYVVALTRGLCDGYECCEV